MNERLDKLSERYPHITTKITLLWGSSQCTKYFEELFFDTRNGNRRGFATEDLMLIFDISEEHKDTFPKLYVESLWDVKKRS